ncbi:TetR/AcrR family transcriptional regulator [Tardiphaga sp.]|uniref:TetR/AcrR family transcriptional regulator n=1 Tax=Tardiphaga sp. TaxID=1926292 RepID=UPI0037D99B5B
MTGDEASARRTNILQSARWCFLNFGFAKTSLDDIAKRASISRTLLYRTFKDKEDIFSAVFEHWLIARIPLARQAAKLQSDSPYQRLLNMCRIMVIEPWNDMVGAPMAGDFYDVCERIDPKVSARHRNAVLECAAEILEDRAAAEVFILALDGLLADEPSVKVLERRTELLTERFASRKKSRSS